MYVLTELANTVLAYKYNGGEIEFLQEIPTLPADFTGQSTAAAIHVSPDGKLLGASNRGHDSIALFKIQDGGGLDFLRYIPDCIEPRDFRFSPDGKWLLAGNQNEDSVTIFEAGLFERKGKITLPKPVCILFGGEV
jgi:6-phosphogluconolactonase